MTPLKNPDRKGSAIAAAFRSFRKREGVTQQALGAALGCPGNSISQYETGLMHPRPERLVRFLRILTGAPERPVVAEALIEDGIPVSDAGPAPTFEANAGSAFSKASAPNSIRTLRQRRGLDQKSFSKAIRISVEDLAAFEDGTADPSPIVMLRLYQFSDDSRERSVFAALATGANIRRSVPHAPIIQHREA